MLIVTTKDMPGWDIQRVCGEVLTIAMVAVLLPTVDETPQPLRDAAGTIIYPGFSADVLYEFRVPALGTQLVFTALAGRLLGDRTGSGQGIAA